MQYEGQTSWASQVCQLHTVLLTAGSLDQQHRPHLGQPLLLNPRPQNQHFDKIPGSYALTSLGSKNFKIRWEPWTLPAVSPHW
jgi:hypothetical protein